MALLPRIASLWRNLSDKESVDRELSEELRAHVDLLTDKKIGEGLAPEEARRAALIEVGGIEQVKERVREVRTGRPLEDLTQDLRYALRGLRKNRGFTVVAVITLALGIGANTAIFTVINTVLLRPLPFERPDELVVLTETISERPIGVSYPNFVDWRNQSTAFENVVAVRNRESFNLTGAGESERLQGRLVSANFLATLGVKPIRGRDFLAEEDKPGANPAAIISHALWQRRFGADETITGKQLTLSGQQFTVIGITPPNFEFGSAETDVYVPIGLSAERFKLRGKDPGINSFARLKPGASIESANAELNTIAARLEQQYPDTNTGRRVRVEPLRENVVAEVRPTLLTLLGAVGFVLLIACANVANLLLTRSAGRQKEMAIRTALGAGRARILRQLFTESTVLALAGGLVGLLLAIWGTHVISSYIPEGIPRMNELGIDGRVLLFTLGASLLTGMFFGLAPALQSSDSNLTETLKEGERNSSRGHNRAGKLLVISEVALTLVLLVGAGLLVKSFWRLSQVDPGFNPQNVLAMQISISARPEEGPRVDGFLSNVQSRLKALPGVQSVSVSNGLPFEGANFPPFVIEGQSYAPGAEPDGLLYIVSPDYFKTIGIELVRGRLFSSQDTRQTPQVALIDEVFSRQYFPNQDPIGRRFKLNTPDAETHEIIGVVRHVEHTGLEGQTANIAEFYFNFDQLPIATLPRYVRRVNVLVRTTVEPLSLAGPVRNQISALDKDQAVFNVRTLEQALSRSVAARRFSMILLGVFAILALTLAAVGIYGVISYSVAQRTREVGIRMALGAKTSDVIKLIVRDGLKLVLIGVGVGLAGALLLTRMMTTLLFGVTPTDAVTYATVALVLIAVALIACCIPARRATKVDPLVALRFE